MQTHAAGVRYSDTLTGKVLAYRGVLGFYSATVCVYSALDLAEFNKITCRDNMTSTWLDTRLYKVETLFKIFWEVYRIYYL